MTRPRTELCIVSGSEFPPDKEEVKRRALRIERISAAYFITAIALVALVMGQSKAMRTAWVDDILGLLSPIAVLLPWVADAAVRMRENGHVLFGEAYVVPVDEVAPLRRIREVHQIARRMDWRLHDLTVQLVAEIDGPIARIRAGAAPSATEAEPAPEHPRRRRRAAGSLHSARRGE